MAIAVDKSTKLFTGSKPEVAPVLEYQENVAREAQKQSVDKDSGLPLWQVNVELLNGDNVETGIKLKIASANAPVVNPRTDYVVDAAGQFVANVYVNQNSGRAAVSYKVVGNLVPVKNSAPFAVNKD